MTSYRLHGVLLSAVLMLAAEGVSGQGIPVNDQAAIAKQIESIAQLKSQLDALNEQIGQARQLYGSLNKLTDMADVAEVLNDPAIRKALPLTSLPSRDCSKATAPACSVIPPQGFWKVTRPTALTPMISTLGNCHGFRTRMPGK